MESPKQPFEQRPIFEADKDGFVNFGEVSRRLLNMQAQYGSRFIDGAFGEYPKLGEGLRIKGNSDDYHNLRIHRDDIDEFMNRYNAHLSQQKF